MVAAIDTLEIVKRLKGAGLAENQAEAVTGVRRDLRETGFSKLATKADLSRLEAVTKAEVSRLEATIEPR